MCMGDEEARTGNSGLDGLRGYPRRQWPLEYGKRQSGYCRQTANRGICSLRMDPWLLQLGPSCGGSMHASAASVPNKRRLPPSDAVGQSIEAQIGTTVLTRVRMRDGQGPVSPQALTESGTDTLLSCLIADRAYDINAFRAGLAQRGLGVVMPTRARRAHPQPHDPKRYPTPRAAARGFGWLKHKRRG